MAANGRGKRVLVLGHGEMGHAMEALLGERATLTIWERHPPAGTPPVDPEAEAARSDAVVFALPAAVYGPLAERLRPALCGDTVCIGMAKGLDGMGRAAYEAFADAFGATIPFTFLYGPMIAEDLSAGMPGFAEVGGSCDGAVKRARSLFEGSHLYLRASRDLPGIAWAVILKNVYAILFGLADELRLGDNMRGYLAATALEELDHISRALGGQRGTPYRLAGLGDLITTATSEDSHHHELGRRIGRGERAGLEGEGVNTLAVLRDHPRFDTDPYPLFRLARRLVEQPAVEPRAAIREYLERRFAASS